MVWIIEDDAGEQELLSRSLHRMGFPHVQFFSNAESALQALHTLSILPQWIVTDINLPELDGPSFLKECTRLCLESGMLIPQSILVSGVLPPDLSQRIHGIDNLRACFEKPDSPKEYAQILVKLWSEVEH